MSDITWKRVPEAILAKPADFDKVWDAYMDELDKAGVEKMEDDYDEIRERPRGLVELEIRRKAVQRNLHRFFLRSRMLDLRRRCHHYCHHCCLSRDRPHGLTKVTPTT